jgi:hypothetical protein
MTSRPTEIGVASARYTKCASTSRTRHSPHHDGVSQAPSSKDSMRSAIWQRRTGTSRQTSAVSMAMSLSGSNLSRTSGPATAALVPNLISTGAPTGVG